MELTPEERQKIYLEENARFDIRSELESQTVRSTVQPTIIQSRPSNGVAAVLSLIIPGAGQMYMGKVGVGIAWLIFTILPYLCFIWPGLILHFICIFDAATTQPAEVGR